MKLKIAHFVLLLILSCASITSRAASPIAIQCDNCSAAQLYNTVITSGVVGTHYFYDLTQGTITAWQITREANTPGHYLYDAVEVPVPSAVLTAYAQEKALIKENGGPVFLQHMTYQAGGFPDPTAGVYDVVQFTAVQNDISAALTNEQLIALNIDAFITAAQNLVLRDTPILFQVEIALVDGGKVTFQWTPGTHEASLVKAVDINNNTIPLELSGLPGKYRFGSGRSGPGGFVGFLHDNGITIPGGVPVCTNYELACTGGNGTYGCEFVKCN